MGCPDFWPNIILDVSVRVLVAKTDIWISRLPSHMWVKPHPKEGQNRTKWSILLKVREHPSCLKIFKLGHCLFSFLYTWTLGFLSWNSLHCVHRYQLILPMSCWRNWNSRSWCECWYHAYCCAVVIKSFASDLEVPCLLSVFMIL